MQYSKRKTRYLCIILVIALLVIFTSGCAPARECTRCDRTFRGQAFYGVRPLTLMCRPCAREYWDTIDYTRFRSRD